MHSNQLLWFVVNKKIDLLENLVARVDTLIIGGGIIGLNIARTLVRAHGGDVTAESAGPRLGSTFEISLPKYVG